MIFLTDDMQACDFTWSGLQGIESEILFLTEFVQACNVICWGSCFADGRQAFDRKKPNSAMQCPHFLRTNSLLLFYNTHRCFVWQTLQTFSCHFNRAILPQKPLALFALTACCLCTANVWLTNSHKACDYYKPAAVLSLYLHTLCPDLPPHMQAINLVKSHQARYQLDILGIFDTHFVITSAC